MAVVEHVLEAEGAADRQLPALGEALQRIARARGPAAAADDHERPLRGREQLAQARQRFGRRRGERGLDPRQHRRRGRRRQHVFGQRQDDRPGPALHRDVIGAADVFGQAVGVVDLADPLGEAERSGTEHLPIVDLLERLAIALAARHLADEEDHRRRVLERGVQADRGVARAGPAGHEAEPRPAAELALRFGHVARAAFVTAGDEADPVAMFVEAVERGEEAFAGNAERGARALGDQRLDQCVAGGTR